MTDHRFTFVIACAFVGCASVACAQRSTVVYEPDTDTSGTHDKDGNDGGKNIVGDLIEAGSSADAGRDGSRPDSGGSTTEEDGCAIVSGTYTLSYDKAPGTAASCIDVPDQTIELDPEDVETTVPGCTIEVDDATCTWTTICVSTTGGSTTTTKAILKKTAGGYEGATGAKVVNASGQVTYDCAYDITYTKK